MPVDPVMEDTKLAALISSKICHDLAGQIGAINNGLELLEDETDEDTKDYALELIHNSARAAWAQLDFHRIAFGASSSLDAIVHIDHLEKVARRYIENGKRRLHWQAMGEELGKEHAKLLLALLAYSLTALPAGGDIYAGISAPQVQGKKVSPLKIVVLCRGRSARLPERAHAIFSGEDLDNIDGRSVLPYYLARLASDGGIRLDARQDGQDIILSAQQG